ncbi:MAG: addiction module component CHP02574 family protein [Kiritimatiellae bacterium]|nr:addiction module component CHP02574 family protein [Kiritimatiellia bacterium]
MDTSIIQKMNTQEQLQTMEQLWDNLCRRCDYPLTPEWHEDILNERKAILDSENASLLSLDEIRKQRT